MGNSKKGKCLICGKPIELKPSAEERARKDVTGKTASYYRNLFKTHSSCELANRSEGVRSLIKRLDKDRLRATVKL